MKNLKWFLGLALALTFMAWQTPKVLAASGLQTNLEIAIERLKSALNLLAASDSLTQSNGNFGYYLPAWERGQVLGDTDNVTGLNNFPPCPSGQVYLCSGNTNPGPNMTCPSGGQPACGVLSNNQPQQPTATAGCPSFSYCNGKVVRKDFNGVMCDVCESNSQPNQNNQQYQPWADMCKDNTALACVDGSGKFITSPKQGSDGQPVCPAGATAKCGNYQTNNQQYQGYQPQQGQPGQMMGPNQGQGDNQNWEEQQAKMDAQRLKDMKKNASRMASEAKRINSEITRLVKKGVVIPNGVKVAQQVITGFVAEVKAATDPNALDDSFMNFQDAMQTIQDAMPTLYQLSNWPQMKKEATKRLTELNKMHTKYSKLKSKVDLSSYLTEVRTGIDAKQALFAQTDNEVKTGSADSLENFPDDFFGDLQDLYGQFQAMDIVSNAAKNIKTFETGLKADEKAITAYAKKKGVDAESVQELKDLLTAVKERLAEVKQILTTKFNPDEMMSAMDDLMTAKGDLGDKLQEFTGKGGTQFMPNIPQQNMNFQFNVPQAFGNQGPQVTPNNQGGGQQQGQQMGPNNQGGFNQDQQMGFDNQGGGQQQVQAEKTICYGWGCF